MLHWKKNTFVFLLSQMISLIGSAIVQYAITWHITLETQSGVYATIAVICGFVPTFLLSPLAGVWADRYNRKSLIIIADGCIAFTTLLLAIAFMMGYDYLWLLFLALAIRGLGTAIQTPCVSAILPDMVPEQHLGRINGIHGSTQSIANLLCPVISGALLSLTSMQNIFLVDVVTAIIAIFVMVKFLHIPHIKKEVHEQKGALKEVQEGITYIMSKKFLKAMFISCILLWFMAGALIYLPPIQIVRIFGDDLWLLTAVETACGLGMIIGGIGFSIWGGFKNSAYTMAFSLFIMSGAIILMGIPFNIWFYLSMALSMCIMLSIFDTCAITLLQKKVDSEYIGRVFGCITMFSSSLMPLGMLLFGPLADMIAIEIIMILCGIVVFFVAILFLALPALKNIDKEVN